MKGSAYKFLKQLYGEKVQISIKEVVNYIFNVVEFEPPGDKESLRNMFSLFFTDGNNTYLNIREVSKVF
jgi:hypothetical protein